MFTATAESWTHHTTLTDCGNSLSAGHITTLTRGGPYVDPVVTWTHHHANQWCAVRRPRRQLETSSR